MTAGRAARAVKQAHAKQCPSRVMTEGDNRWAGVNRQESSGHLEVPYIPYFLPTSLLPLLDIDWPQTRCLEAPQYDTLPRLTRTVEVSEYHRYSGSQTSVEQHDGVPDWVPTQPCSFSSSAPRSHLRSGSLWFYDTKLSICTYYPPLGLSPSSMKPSGHLSLILPISWHY